MTPTAPELTAMLATFGTSAEGDLVYLETTKKGVRRRGSVHDNDTVAVLVWTGFEYKALIERSVRKMASLQSGHKLVSNLALACSEQAAGADLSEVCAAIQETELWFHRVLTSPRGFDPLSEPKDPTVWKPLIVDGKHVHGCRIWDGVPNPEVPEPLVPGTVYLQGVKLGEAVLTKAASSWATRSAPKTVAKRILRSWLPVGLYVQYALVPGTHLSTGQEAVRQAKVAGISVDPEAVRSLFKVA